MASISDPPPGQLNASLTAFLRILDEYSAQTKQEIVPEKQEKAQGRIKNFRAELVDFREQFDLVKKQRDETVRVHI